MFLQHKVEGSGPPLVMSSSLGATHVMWDPQVPALAARFRVIRYDHPGHGGSPVGPNTIDGLARVVLELADELAVERFSFCGLSLGGMVGMWLAANAPDRIEKLVLACTAPHFPPREQWLERAQIVRERGPEAIVDVVVQRWFTARFREHERARWRELFVSTSPEGYARCCEALADADLRRDLARIGAPTLVIAGSEDPVVSEEAIEQLAQLGSVVRVDAAHLANVERPREFTGALLEHIA